MKEKDKPIGIFDSGVGGLTVVKEVIRHLPNESIIYLGDTARVPYGIKSPETVIKYSRQNTNFLKERGIKLLVAACNTSSAVSLSILREETDISVIGVIEPGARAAVRNTKTGNIGVIGTEATIKSGAYEKAINQWSVVSGQWSGKKIEVASKACPMFVPLAEEGWFENEVAEMTAEVYLSDFRGKRIDVLVLGCTHYPLLKKTIQKSVGNRVILIDSAEETPKEIEILLRERGLLSDGKSRFVDFYVTDNPERFSKVGKAFLGENGLSRLSAVDLSNY
ncbi:MAG: glutamate racemase [Nitrospinae bacterium RIFCSPLOWO2_12_39_16]|nr:MAG: glutamate racemase [Nitrospinae bacterium RIFCSPLOWO2_12_39_16]